MQAETRRFKVPLKEILWQAVAHKVALKVAMVTTPNMAAAAEAQGLQVVLELEKAEVRCTVVEPEAER